MADAHPTLFVRDVLRLLIDVRIEIAATQRWLTDHGLTHADLEVQRRVYRTLAQPALDRLATVTDAELPEIFRTLQGPMS